QQKPRPIRTVRGSRQVGVVEDAEPFATARSCDLLLPGRCRAFFTDLLEVFLLELVLALQRGQFLFDHGRRFDALLIAPNVAAQLRFRAPQPSDAELSLAPLAAR